MKRDEGNKGEYTPACREDGLWTKANIFDGFAFYSAYKLGVVDICTLQYICGYCDRSNNMIHHTGTPACPLSYGDIAEKACCSLVQARKSIKRLLELKLILCVNESKGRKSSCYVPNNKVIRMVKGDYLDDVEKDRDPSTRGVNV